MREPDFRRLWSAQFVSNIGSWMQTVAAQWVLMLLAAAALAVLSLAGALTPAILLALLFVIGCGTAASAPTWQTLQPELVPAAGGFSQAGPRLDRLRPAARLCRGWRAWRRDLRTGAAQADGPARALRIVRRCGSRDGDRARLLGQLRRRTGAGSWRLYRQAEDRYELVETFIVGSWAEHERQHARMYPSDTGVLDRLDQTLLPDRPRLVQHSLAVRTRHQHISKHDG
jgi:hypothetical protein